MWQPIHTAPNDETLVLTCFMADGQPRFQVVPAHMIHHVVSREDRVGMHQRDGSWPQPKRFYYSHWMPIPPPPSTDSKKAGTMKVYIVIHDDTGEGGAVVMVTTTRDKAVKMCADPGSSLVWEEHDLDAPLFEMEQKRPG